MNRLVEIRSQECLCRERAALDFQRRVFWLAQAQEWEQRALDGSPIISGSAMWLRRSWGETDVGCG
jgi:hypothetical protein